MLWIEAIPCSEMVKVNLDEFSCAGRFTFEEGFPCTDLPHAELSHSLAAVLACISVSKFPVHIAFELIQAAMHI